VPPGADDAAIAALNARIMERVNARGAVYLSHTKLGGQYTLRLAIGNIRTDRQHIELAWHELRAAAAALEAGA
jgi:aromatic-L-amino-acid decarboxylase